MLYDADILRDAAAAGFRKEIFEEVYHLLGLLELLCRLPYVLSRVVLKGRQSLREEIGECPTPVVGVQEP
jgi:hypothetical protein